MNATMLRPLPQEPVPALATAHDAYQQVRMTRREWIREADRRRLGINLSRMPAEKPSARITTVESEAGEYLVLARRNPRKAEAELNLLLDKIDDIEPAYTTAKVAYDAACSIESRRIAEELLPRHRHAVRVVNELLEKLFVALKAEVEVRDEFQRTSPTPWPSQLLPDMSSTFKRALWLDHRDSNAAIWQREARSKGLL